MVRHQAMVNMVVDQNALGIRYGLFHGMQLLCHIGTGCLLLKHFNHFGQMPMSSLEPGDSFGMRGVRMGHTYPLPPHKVQVNLQTRF